MAWLYVKKDTKPIKFPDEQFEVVEKAWEGWVNNRQNRLIRLSNQSIMASDIAKVERGSGGEVSKEIEIPREDVKAFHKVLEPYLNDKGHLTMDAEMTFLKDKGCIVFEKEKEVGKTISDFHNLAIVKEKIPEYQDLQKMISAWSDYQGRIAYAKKKELEELNQIAYESVGKEEERNTGGNEDTDTVNPDNGEGPQESNNESEAGLPNPFTK